MRKLLVVNIVSALLICLAVSNNGFVLAQETLERPLVVEVRDEAGQPIRDACVTFVPKNGEILFIKANAKGRAEFKSSAKRAGRVIVKVEGYQAQKKEIAAGADAVAFALEPRRER